MSDRKNRETICVNGLGDYARTQLGNVLKYVCVRENNITLHIYCLPLCFGRCSHHHHLCAYTDPDTVNPCRSRYPKLVYFKGAHQTERMADSLQTVIIILLFVFFSLTYFSTLRLVLQSLL